MEIVLFFTRHISDYNGSKSIGQYSLAKKIRRYLVKLVVKVFSDSLIFLARRIFSDLIDKFMTTT
jgi:hypothetical protein